MENDYPPWYDAVWRCDLLYATSLNGLRVVDEAQREVVDEKLLEKAVLLHQNGYLGVQSDSHNYCGDIPIYTSGGGWSQVYTLF